MITINMTAGNDNQLIWLVQIQLSTGILRYATRQIELDNFWLGGKIGYESLTGISQTCNITNGGGIIDLSELNFSTKKNNSLFITDISPTNTKPNLIGSRVSLGYIWENATLDSEITWMWEGYVYDYTCTVNTMRLDLLEYSDIESEFNVLPYYKIQNVYDDGISYYTKIEKEILGVAIPIVYGDFSGNSISSYLTSYLAPAVLVDNTLLTYKFASHQVLETFATGSAGNEDDFYIFDNNIDNYIRFVPDNGDTLNLVSGLTRRVFDTTKASGESVIGDTVAFFSSAGKASDVVDIEAILDNTAGNYYTLADTKQISLKPNKTWTNSYKIGTNATSVKLNVSVESVGTGQITLAYYDPLTDTYSTVSNTALTSGVITGVQYNAGGTIDVQNIFNYEWIVKNTSGAGVAIKVYDAVVYINDILLYKYPRRLKSIIMQPINIPKLNFTIKVNK